MQALVVVYHCTMCIEVYWYTCISVELCGALKLSFYIALGSVYHLRNLLFNYEMYPLKQLQRLCKIHPSESME